MQGFYYGGYPWKDWGILTAADLNAAISYAFSVTGGSTPVPIPDGSITNAKLATPYVIIGSSQIFLGVAGNNKLTGMADPSLPSDYTTKSYVDNLVTLNIPANPVTVGGTKLVPTSGTTVNAPNGFRIGSLLLVPATSLAVLTVTAPANPLHLDAFEVSTSQYIDNLAVVPNGSNLLQGGSVGSLGGGGGKSWRFWQPDNTWYPRY